MSLVWGVVVVMGIGVLMIDRFWQRQRGAEETIHIGRALIAEVCFSFIGGSFSRSWY